uniref:Mediator complex subunit 10 n=1 Tax=Aegilops tauschii subsp. strangulata TaxID=200361 RepID=A0A453G8N8_AEGTS
QKSISKTDFAKILVQTRFPYTASYPNNAQEELVLDYNDEMILSICFSQSLRKHLLEELEEAFPDDAEAYRQIRATSAAGSKRLAQSQSALPNGDAKVKPEH